MADTLSQDEVDALLKGISDGDVEVEEKAEPGETLARPYNLIGEERSIGRQFPGLDLVHERFVRKLRQTIGLIAGSAAVADLIGLELLRFGTFRNRLTPGAPLCLFSMQPMRGQALLTIEPALAFQLVDRIFGGPGRPPEDMVAREYSAIELQVLQRVVTRILGDLAEAWAPVHVMECNFVRTETNPALVTMAVAEENVMSLELGIDLGVGRGRIVIAIPFTMIEPLRAKLGEPQAEPTGTDRTWLAAMTSAVRSADVGISVELGRCELRAADVLRMRVGDVLPLGRREDDPLEVCIEDRPILQGVAGTSRGQNAVRLLDGAGAGAR